MMHGLPARLRSPPRVLQSIFGSTPIGSVHDQGIYVELSLGVLTGVSQNVGGPSKIARLMTSLRATCARRGTNRRTSAR
jgi:hypothetical protein